MSVRKRYRRDPRALPSGPAMKGRGLPKDQHQYKTVCVSLWKDDLAELDAWCERTQVSRSRFLRQASKYFIAYLQGADHHNRVSEVA